MESYKYISVFLSVLLSGMSVLLFSINNRNLKLLLSFSGSFLFAISALHLMPEIYESAGHNAGMFIVLGFFIQVLLELFSEGIEHGHVHIHHHNERAFPLTMMIGLCIHSFLEGMPLSGHFDHSHELLVGIILHNIPIAVAFMTMLLQSGTKKSTAFILLLVFALMTPAGTFANYLIGAGFQGELSVYTGYIMAVVVGIFLHISTTILFESSENHRFNILKFAVIILGAASAFIGFI